MTEESLAKPIPFGRHKGKIAEKVGANMLLSEEGLFKITSVSKDDILREYKYSGSEIKEQVKRSVEKMDDADMEHLASKMADDYCEQLFWGSLRVIFEDHFLESDFE